MKTSLIAFCALAVLPAAASPALALDISARGADIFLNGPINLGDHAKFERFMMENHGQSFRTVHLNSPGGWSSDMREIARDIRKARLNTAVDGSRAICASACTVLFAAGVQRFYHGADKVPEGVGRADMSPGLGYHGASNSLSTIQMSGFSPGAGTQQIINLYYEFGSSSAARLATKAEPSQLYRVSGPTALSMGIATSLDRPR